MYIFMLIYSNMKKIISYIYIEHELVHDEHEPVHVEHVLVYA